MKERSIFAGKDTYTILLADDDPDDRDLFEEAATYLNPTASIISFKDGVELMNYLIHDPPTFDMIFLDLNMPKKNGKECLIEIGRDTKYGAIPVIIYTTSINPIDIEGTFTAGAFRFFRKPNSFDELKEILSIAYQSAIHKSITRSRENFVLSDKGDFTG